MSLLAPIIIYALITLALGIKWQIKRRIILGWMLFISVLYALSAYLFLSLLTSLSMLTVGVIGFMQSVLISIAGLLICFFRDPERNPPKDRNSILSPADGEIVYIKKINKDEFPFAIKKRNHIPLSELTRNDFISCGGYQVGIGMNFLNVHVNRSPITGQVMQLNKIRGKFESLRKIKSLLENERVSTVIQGDKMSVCVVQIASRLVRRIISYIDTGHLVKSGQRIGMICFGSQVDVLIPNGKDLKILVKEKDEVKAGLSIIAKY